MTENGLAIRRNPCLRCENKDLCGICELNILRQKEQPPKRVEYKKTEEIQMRNENEMKNAACEPHGWAEALRFCRVTEKPYNPYEETVHLMLSSDYKARFVAEYRQTKIRYGKLKAYCDRIEMAMMPSPQGRDAAPRMRSGDAETAAALHGLLSWRAGEARHR